MKEPTPTQSNLALAALIVALALLFGWLLSAMPAKAAQQATQQTVTTPVRVLAEARMRCHVTWKHGKRVKVCKLQQPPPKGRTS